MVDASGLGCKGKEKPLGCRARGKGMRGSHFSVAREAITIWGEKRSVLKQIELGRRVLRTVFAFLRRMLIALQSLVRGVSDADGE